MAQVIAITFEGSTTLLDHFTSVTDAHTDLVINATAALVGSQGLACTIADTTAFYGVKTFTTLTSTLYRSRIYIDPNALTMANLNSFYPYVVANGTSSRLLIQLGYTAASGFNIMASVRDDANTFPATAAYNITDASHYVEALVELASGADANDGKLTLWVDNVQQEQLTDIDLYALTKPDRIYAGAVSGIDAGTSGTFYLDDIVLRDDGTAIGPAASGVPIAAIADHYRRMHV